MAKGLLAVALVACVASLAACKSPEQIRAEQDVADDQRCARMGIPAAPGDPGYVQCRMWAAQMRAQEEQAQRENVMLALQALSALQQRRQAQLYDEQDEPPRPFWPQPPWIVPPPAPQNTWCRPVGRWMSCTSQ